MTYFFFVRKPWIFCCFFLFVHKSRIWRISPPFGWTNDEWQKSENLKRFDEISWLARLEQTALRGLNFTGILLTSFFFIRKQQMSELLLHETSFFLENIRKSRIVDETSLKNDLTKFLEWQKSESLKEFWWDFLTCLLEQTALRCLNSPASFWLLSFSFVNRQQMSELL